MPALSLEAHRLDRENHAAANRILITTVDMPTKQTKPAPFNRKVFHIHNMCLKCFPVLS